MMRLIIKRPILWVGALILFLAWIVFLTPKKEQFADSPTKSESACPVTFATQDSVNRLEDSMKTMNTNITTMQQSIQEIRKQEIPKINQQLKDHQKYIDTIKNAQKELTG